MRVLPMTSLAMMAAALALPAWGQGTPQQAGQAPGQAGSPPYHRADTPGRPAVPESDMHYSQSMQRLFQAAQRLREAVQAMAQQPAGPNRDQAMQTAERAILETQEAMVQLPENLRGQPEYQQAKSQLDETHRMLRDKGADPRQTQASAERFASGVHGWQGGIGARQLRQQLGQAGFRDVQILDTTYLVRAVTPDGQPVLMVLNPPSGMGMTSHGQASSATGAQAPTAPSTSAGTGSGR
jgi:hypothetical protein